LIPTEYPLSSVGIGTLRLVRFQDARLIVNRAPNHALKCWSVEVLGSEIRGPGLAHMLGEVHEVRIVLLKTRAICWGDATMETTDETGHCVLVGAGDLHSWPAHAT
jgi:hypothetical protein